MINILRLTFVVSHLVSSLSVVAKNHLVKQTETLTLDRAIGREETLRAGKKARETPSEPQGPCLPLHLPVMSGSQCTSYTLLRLKSFSQ